MLYDWSYLSVIRPSTSPGTDAAAGASAAFAACSVLYSNRNLGPSYSNPASLQNSSYAATLLIHAQDLYAFAVNASGGQQTYQSAFSQAGIAYPSSSYGDDLAMAALFLAWATNSSDYYSQAEGYYRQYSLGRTNSVFNWDSKSPALAVLFAQLANAGTTFAGNLSGWQAEAEQYFDRILNGGSPSFKTNGARLCSYLAYILFAENEITGGLLWYPGDSDDASLNPALNAAMLLTRYAQIATTQEKTTNYLVHIFSKNACGPLADNTLLGIVPVTARLRARKKPHVRRVSATFLS